MQLAYAHLKTDEGGADDVIKFYGTLGSDLATQPNVRLQTADGQILVMIVLRYTCDHLSPTCCYGMPHDSCP